MGKINVGELREVNKEFKGAIITKFKGLEIEVKQYIPILDKIELVSPAANGCISEENGLFTVQNSVKNIAYKLAIIKAYTNITLPKDEFDAFDLINESGILQAVMNAIPKSELEELDTLLHDMIEEQKEIYMQNNTLENIVKNGIEEILVIINKFLGDSSATDLIESATKAVNGLKPDKLKFVQDFIKANKGEK